MYKEGDKVVAFWRNLGVNAVVNGYSERLGQYELKVTSEAFEGDIIHVVPAHILGPKIEVTENKQWDRDNLAITIVADGETTSGTPVMETKELGDDETKENPAAESPDGTGE